MPADQPPPAISRERYLESHPEEYARLLALLRAKHRKENPWTAPSLRVRSSRRTR